MNNDGYNKSAAHDIVEETYFHRLLNNDDQVYGRNNSRYQRLNLVYTSIISDPTLVNARFIHSNSKVWSHNAIMVWIGCYPLIHYQKMFTTRIIKHI